MRDRDVRTRRHPQTEAERLYDVLDRLAYQVWENEALEHKFSPLGSAVDLLHEFAHLRTQRCIIVDEVERPGA